MVSLLTRTGAGGKFGGEMSKSGWCGLYSPWNKEHKLKPTGNDMDPRSLLGGSMNKEEGRDWRGKGSQGRSQ